MNASAAPTWPPAQLPLAPRIFPERAEVAGLALDRWAAGWLVAVDPRRDRPLRRAVAAQVQALAAAADEAVDAALARAARRAFIGGEAQALATALAAAVVGAQRALGLAAHPPQVDAAAALLRGRMVELDTGEGKTLTAALAACVAARAGVPVHVITVNDYLAQRDADTMAPLLGYFGLAVGVIHGGVPHPQRAAAYRQPVVYATNKDLAFDYLRDRVACTGVHSAAQWRVRRLHRPRRDAPLRLRGLHFAIVDEADSVLVDEARTPLILSAQQGDEQQAEAWRALLELAALLELGRDFRLNGEQRVPELLAEGRRRLDALAPADADDSPLAEFWRVEWVREHYLAQALRVLHTLVRDQHYVVQDGKVVIVDEFTGRLLPDRSWEQGLHQLVEAREGVAISGRNRTLARLTYQSLFSRYLRLSGMSGTLREVARETAAVYRVRTRRIEPHRPCLRVELPTRLLRDRAAKHAAVLDEVRGCVERGQPVLVGTRSVHASQAISDVLAAAGIAHRVLNALQDADEAALVAAAGQVGAVTVATNMAGRGTDIRLADGVAALGGLHVVLTEWHESARIDRQLYGRCARQGDPGSCRAIVALDDEIVERFAGALARRLARAWPDALPPLAARWLRRWVQRRAEGANAAQRRQTMRQQRTLHDQLAFAGVPE